MKRLGSAVFRLSLSSSFFLLLVGTTGCSDGSDDTVDATGGLSTGGGSGGATGGAASGGMASGGMASGGASGGTASGGEQQGGSGGASTGGSQTGGSATGGDGSGGGLTLEMPIEQEDGTYALSFGETRFVVDAARGARITSFSHGGTELLSPVETAGSDDNEFLNGGSTFWLSPQSGWYADADKTWPPIETIDSGVYTATLDGSTIVTSSSIATIGASVEFSVMKSFAVDLQTAGIDITYTIKNEGTAAASHGPWEVSRHPRGGLTFWAGTDVPGTTWGFSPTEMAGVYWWDDAGATELDEKIFSDGSEGWLGHVAGDLLLVKVWQDGSSLAPDHGEVEVYLGDGYIEIEEHGTYGEVAPGASTSFPITWYVQRLDAGVDKSVGSAQLLEMARALAAN